jgi:hypothetical protein
MPVSSLWPDCNSLAPPALFECLSPGMLVPKMNKRHLAIGLGNRSLNDVTFFHNQDLLL